MLEILGRKNSSNVMPVMWAVGELGCEHVRHNVGGSFGGLDSPDYGTLNPNRHVPTINDNGFVLWESNAIVRYLCAQYGKGSLWPNEPKELAIADQWMEWCKTTAFPLFFPIFLALVRTSAEQRDLTAINKQAASLGDTLTILDDRLADRPFVAGESLTMGDIPLGAMAYRYYNLAIDRPSLPNVEAWYQKLCKRAPYQQHVMFPFGSSPEEWLGLERQGI